MTKLLPLAVLVLLVAPTAWAQDDDASEAAEPLVHPSLPTPTIRAAELPQQFRPQRHAFLVGGLFLAGGLAFGHAAREDALIAEGDPHARSARLGFDSARGSATAANVSFALAGVAIAYG